MTETHIKEQLSNNFIRILAANKGFMLDKPELDYGVDFTVSKIHAYNNPNGGTRYLKDNKYIDIQLKATTEASVTIDSSTGNIKYDLEVKNFNDLATRKLANNNNLSPLILILFVLPSDRNLWVHITNDEILLRKCAYWYVPPDGTQLSSNVSKERINIPTTNLLSINCFDDLYQTFYS
ncbi:DUF4365 domain-containing protein [Chitinophaga pollutisoli]|uniref:DUF4365 domain-containing protein n=1 Tax=Chitinophaga pollutisoli TaxID=3133966 RepID=A0ABZ2YKT8_9BACT